MKNLSPFLTITYFEMILRSIKSYLQFKLRKQVLKTYLPIEDSYRQLIATKYHHLSHFDDEIWKNPTQIKLMIRFKFGDKALSPEENHPEYNLLQKLPNDKKKELISLIPKYAHFTEGAMHSDYKLGLYVKGPFESMVYEIEFMQFYRVYINSKDYEVIRRELFNNYVFKIHFFTDKQKIEFFIDLLTMIIEVVQPDDIDRFLEIFNNLHDEGYITELRDNVLVNRFILNTLFDKNKRLITDSVIKEIVDDHNCDFTELDLSGSSITKKSLRLLTRFKDLKQLDISHVKNIDKDALVGFVEDSIIERVYAYNTGDPPISKKILSN